MIDLYFEIKLICSALIIGFVVLICAIIFIKCLLVSIKENKVENYLESIGYQRTLISTASVGNNHTYGYIRNKTDNSADIIRDYEIRNMSLKQIKQKYI